MAQPINCDVCETELAALMVSNIGTGDVFAVGPDCLPQWLTNMLAELVPTVAPDEPAEAETAATAAEAPQEPRKGGGKGTKPGRHEPAATGPDDTEPAGELAGHAANNG